MLRYHLVTCFFISIIVLVESSNILILVPFYLASHYVFLRPLGLELAERGHNVTIVTSFKEKVHPPSYHQVMSDDKIIWDALGIQRPNLFTMVDLSAEKFHEQILWSGGLKLSEVALSSKPVQELLAKDNQFDVVISEQFFQESLNLLAHKYSAPLVLITTQGNCMRHNILTRNPLQIATVVAEFLTVRNPTSFWGRFRNFYFSMYEYIWWRLWYLPQQEEIAAKYIKDVPKPVPSLYELQQNASLMLLNSHFSFDAPAAYLPNIVEIAGMHLSKSDNLLPDDIQKLLDEASHGVVYVNFGSNVKSSELPIEKKNAFLNVFKRLKQTVVWKWEDDTLKDKSNNVFIRKWLPQKEILAHPNIKVFISHGGLIGTEEAIFNGVPIIGIPIYSDQYNNLLQAEEAGYGKILEFHNINEETLDSMLHEVLKDDTYTNKAKEVSLRFKDRPMSALDTAVFWVEYVIRHKGATFMKNPALNISWIAYTMLDVYALILASCLIVFSSIVFLLLLVKKFIGTNMKKKKD